MIKELEWTYPSVKTAWKSDAQSRDTTISKASLWAGSGRSYSDFFDKLWKNPLHSLITFVMYNRLFDDRGHKTKVEIETGSQWIMVALNKVKVCLKFQTYLTSGTGGIGPVLSRHHGCSLRTPRGLVGAANTSRLAAAGRGSGNNQTWV